ncbi:MAG TPA: hypothetical protein VHX90_04875 [Verrucomicrobiae bacterium]|nr:hypothetical protein [Verrucomicrobiae bacterium]
MKRVDKIAICAAGGLALNAALRADDVALPGNPYALIVARNIFGLNPPPPPVDPNAAAPEPEVKITPNGIMSIFGQWQVLFKASGGGKPGDQSYMLGEGQRQDDIEVVKIDEKSSIVTFNNHGVVENLPLASSASTAAPTNPAGALNPVGGVPVPFGGAGNNGVNGSNSFNNRGGNNAGGGNFGGGQNNGANNSLNQTHNTYVAPQPQAAMDPDVQQVLIVANHLKALQDGDPVAQIYPVTDADKEAGIPSNTDPNTTTPDNPSQQ